MNIFGILNAAQSGTLLLILLGLCEEKNQHEVKHCMVNVENAKGL